MRGVAGKGYMPTEGRYLYGESETTPEVVMAVAHQLMGGGFWGRFRDGFGWFGGGHGEVATRRVALLRVRKCYSESEVMAGA
jgi:hypothetical protein